MIDLKSILKQNPSCLNSRAAFKSVLLDKYPSEKRMVNILTILFECGVANKIKAKKIISPNDMQSLLTQVENDYGISAQYSQSAILIWAAAYDITASTVNTQDTATSSKEATTTVYDVPPEYVEGDIDDYDVIEKADGYYITHFNGFEEEEMTIPSLINGKKIRGIGKEAFKGCLTVKAIHISEGIKIIEDGAFLSCNALESVSLPNTLHQIGSISKSKSAGVFAKTNIRSITIPQNTVFLGSYAFADCGNLQNIKLSEKITTIHENTFLFCSKLSDIKLPKQLLKIEEGAFEFCSSLHEVHIPLGTQVIERDAFYGTDLTSIYIPPTVTKIGDGVTNSTLGTNYNNRLIVYCTAGSAAMEYARKNNIKCAKAQF